jgi:PAS domain S-box-containing protein
MPNSLREKHSDSLRHYLATGAKHLAWEGVELTGQHKNGKEISLEISLSEFNDDGKHIFTGIVRDISARRQTDFALRESEARFHNMADTVPVMIWISAADKLYSYVNKSWLEFTGRSLEQELGKGWRESIHPDDLPNYLDKYNAAFEARREFNLEYRFKRRDGTYRWVLNTGVPRLMPDGSFTGYIGSCIDLTEHKQTEDSLRASEEALRQSEERYRTLIEHMPDGVYRSTPEGKYLDVNPAMVKMLGYASKEELLAVDIKTQIYFDPSERESAIQAMNQADQDGVVVIRHRHKDGHEVWLEDHGRLIMDADGKVIYHEGILRDITARKRAEEALRQSEERQRTLVERLTDGVYRSTPDGKFLEVNPAMVKMLGYASKEELMAVDIKKQLYFDEHEREIIVDKLRDAGGDEIDVFRLRRKDGHEVWVEDHGQLIYGADGKVIYHEGILRDISIRKRAEEALRESEERYRSVIGALAEAVVLHDANGSIIACNPSAEHILGIGVEQMRERISINSNWQAIHEDGRPFPIEAHPATISFRTGQPCSNVNMGVYKPTGELTWISINSQPLIRPGEEKPYAVVTSFYDITERKWAEEALRESEERYRLLAENTLDLIGLLDLDGNVLYASPSHYYLIGYTPNELVHQNLFSVVHSEDAPHVLAAINNLLASGIRKTIELRMQKKNGDWVEMEAILSGIPGSGNVIHRILFSARDITTRKQAEEHIRTSLKEKEVLLKEIHHRVKNNLQIISSLLNLQSGYIHDKHAGEMFKESRNRVRSMALIHEKLYQSKDLAKIDFAEYVRHLTTHLFRSYGVNSHAIALKINVDRILFDIDMAIPCGLIVNELVSNSLKYAFPAGAQGEIRIDLHQESNGRLALVVSDNGAGLPLSFDFKKTDSLGLQLVSTLTDQLEGKILLDRNDGTTFKILLQPHNGFSLPEASAGAQSSDLPF